MKVAREFVESTLEDAGLDVRMDYGGRGMYGKDCLGIVTDGSGWALATQVMEAQEYTSYAEEDDLLDYLLTHEPRVDSMGLGDIYYWPGLQVIDEED